MMHSLTADMEPVFGLLDISTPFPIDARPPVLSAVQLSMMDGLPRRKPPDLEARARMHLEQLRLLCDGRPDRVRLRLETARAIARLRRKWEPERLALFALGLHLLDQGAWAAAAEQFRAAQSTDGSRCNEGWCLYGQARAAIERFPHRHVLALCAQALMRNRGHGSPLLAFGIRLTAARGYREAGDRGRSWRCLNRIRRMPRILEEPGFFAAVRANETDLLRDEGRHEDALAACKEAFERMVDFRGTERLTTRRRAAILRQWSELLMDVGKVREARRKVGMAIGLLDPRDQEERGRLHGLLAVLDFEESEEETAFESLRVAEDALRISHSHLALAELLLLRGEYAALRVVVPQARAHAREGILEARMLFRSMERWEGVRRCDLFLETFRSQRNGKKGSTPDTLATPRLPRVPRMRRLSQLGYITADVRILRSLEPLESLARTAIPVLILGESGTGKEVLSRALHRAGGGRGPFVAVNCGALPNELQESELFGHVRGAFTGAVADKIGLFEAADGGTLLLDEVGEMTPSAQVKLLRVLEFGEVRRVGEIRTRRIRVRVLAATNADLKSQIESGVFRRDLYYRLCGLKVDLLPLRDRLGDVPLLSAHFAALFSGNGDGAPLSLSPEALDLLLQHTWPGNVRELRFTIEKAVALTKALGRERIEVDCIDVEPVPVRTPPPRLAPAGEELIASGGLEAYIENTERRLILKALEENDWNRTRAARSLGGMSRTTLIGKMKRLGLFPGTGGAAGGGGEQSDHEPPGDTSLLHRLPGQSYVRGTRERR